MRLTQPQSGPANVDTGTPLGRALRVAVVGSLGTELVRRKTIVRAAGVSRVATTGGVANQHSASNGNLDFGATGGLSTVIPIGTGWTLFMRVYVSTLGVRQGLMTDHNAAGSTESIAVEITAANQWQVANTGGAFAISGGPATIGWHDLMVVHRPGVGNQLYVDRVSLGTAAFVSSLTAGSALRFGSFGAFTGLGFLGRTLACYIFEGDQSAYINFLSANPWQVIETPSPVYLFTANASTGGTSYTLTCAAGAYSITGASAALRAAHKVGAAQGAYALTGQPAATVAAHRMTAAPGAYSVTGNAANLIYVPLGVVLPAAGGSYALTGNTVTMRATRRLVAEGGAYTIAGNAVTNPGEVAPPTGGGGGVGGSGNVREVRAFADLLDKARPTKAAKKRLRRVLEVEALELLPDEPEAVKAAQIIAQVVAKKELQAIERRPADAAPLKALPFDPSEMIARMVAEWLQNEAIQRELEDEFDAEMLLLG